MAPYSTGEDVQVHVPAFSYVFLVLAPVTAAPSLIVSRHHAAIDQSQYEGMVSQIIFAGAPFDFARFYYSGDVLYHDRAGIVSNRYFVVLPAFSVTDCTTSVFDYSGRSVVASKGVQSAINEMNRAAPNDPHRNQGGLLISSLTSERLIPVLVAPSKLSFCLVALTPRCDVAVSMVITRFFMPFLGSSSSPNLVPSAARPPFTPHPVIAPTLYQAHATSPVSAVPPYTFDSVLGAVLYRIQHRGGKHSMETP